jgi:hypothetical protein
VGCGTPGRLYDIYYLSQDRRIRNQTGLLRDKGLQRQNIRFPFHIYRRRDFRTGKYISFTGQIDEPASQSPRRQIPKGTLKTVFPWRRNGRHLSRRDMVVANIGLYDTPGPEYVQTSIVHDRTLGEDKAAVRGKEISFKNTPFKGIYTDNRH